MQIGEVCLLTNDVKALADFYRWLFRIPVNDDDPVHQFVLTEGTTLTIYNDGTRKANNNQNISLAFTVDDVDEEHIRLKDAGVSVLEGPATQPWGARNLHFTDPDGNHIYFRSFPAKADSSSDWEIL